MVADTFPSSFLGCFCHAPCYDLTQRPPDAYDMIIPRASTNSAANSGSSTPSTHTEIGNSAYTLTNGNSVGRTLNPRHPSFFTPQFSLFLPITCLPPDAFLFPCLCACRPLSSCCIHSNCFYRLTVNHFFVWIFFFSLCRAHSLKALCLLLCLFSLVVRLSALLPSFLLMKCKKNVGGV